MGLKESKRENGKDVEAHHSLSEIKLPEGIQVIQDEEGIFWTINTPNLHLVLNVRRGLAIKSLAFKSHRYAPVIGTLPQGYFNTIELGADFYSGGVLIEEPGERSRITDLEWVTPSIRQQGTELLISAVIPLVQGALEKTITIDDGNERVKLTYNFQQFERPLGVVRVGIVTLLPDAFSLPLEVRCANGGPEAELFQIDHEFNHGQAASAFVSSTAAFGATEGQLMITDAEDHRLTLSWNPADCAAIPMLKHQQAGDRHLTRIMFSLCELDDTVRAGGRLMPFTVELSSE